MSQIHEILKNPSLLEKQNSYVRGLFHEVVLESVINLGLLMNKTDLNLSNSMLEIFNSDETTITNFLDKMFPIIAKYTDEESLICNVGELLINELNIIEKIVDT
tara:strand:+ start:767 stop:1078 length:312 start_codon:yes stop_codon:yes gene_type:complete